MMAPFLSRTKSTQQTSSAGGFHAHHELLLDLRLSIHSTYKRVPLRISGEVGEHLPDTLGGSFYLNLGTQLLHRDLLGYLLCTCTSFTAELRRAARGPRGPRRVEPAHPLALSAAQGRHQRARVALRVQRPTVANALVLPHSYQP